MHAQWTRVPLPTIPRHELKTQKLMCSRDLASVHSVRALDSVKWSPGHTRPGRKRAIPDCRRRRDSERSPVAGLAAGGPFNRSEYRPLFRRQWTLRVVHQSLTGLRPEESGMLRFRQTLIVPAIAAAISIPGTTHRPSAPGVGAAVPVARLGRSAKEG